MKSDSVGEYTDVTIQNYQRQLFGSEKNNYGFCHWLRDRGTPVDSFFNNNGCPETAGKGDGKLGALVEDTWTEFLAPRKSQPAMARMQCAQ